MNAAHHPRGQTLVELALVLPLLISVLFAVISFGLWVFYQQQLTNGAREAARYAALHSATSQCPTVSNLLPNPVPPGGYYLCDRPQDRWPFMTAAARQASFGLDRSQVWLSACWSGYKDSFGNYDALPTDPSTGLPNTFNWCSIAAVDPRKHAEDVPQPDYPNSCRPPLTSAVDDQASDLAQSTSNNSSQVTVFACYLWRPPLAGFLLVPSIVTMRSVITEAVRYQQ